MTEYVLTSLEYRQVVKDERMCSECGREKPDVTVETVRYRQGDRIEVTGVEEQRLLDAGAIRPVPDGIIVDGVIDVVDDGAQRVDDAVVRLDEAHAAEQAAADNVADAAEKLADAESNGDPKRPRKVSSHADWVDYAVARGMAREKAEVLTKAELQESLP